MRILIDECVPEPIAKLLSSYECRTVTEQGWSGIQNGELLALAKVEFDLFITSDQNIRYQQNLAAAEIAILELSTNNLRQIERSAELLMAAVNEIGPFEYRQLTIPKVKS